MVDPVVTPVIVKILSTIVTSKEFHEFSLSLLRGAGRELGIQEVRKLYGANSANNISSSKLIQEEFSQNLLQRLGEFHKQSNKTELYRIQNDWDKDNWFSKLNRLETEQILKQVGHRLLILASPPEISLDCPISFKNNLDKEIKNKLGRFLSQNYHQTSPISPVQFYGDYFKESISEIDIRRLKSILQGLPTVVLYSNITDYEVNFNLSVWVGTTNDLVQYHFPAWNWEESYQALQKKRKTKVEAERGIRETIIDTHIVLSSFIIDWYYLQINPLYEPQFQKSIAYLSPLEIKPYIESINNFYSKNQEEIAHQKELLKPESIGEIQWGKGSEKPKINTWKDRIKAIKEETEERRGEKIHFRQPSEESNSTIECKENYYNKKTFHLDEIKREIKQRREGADCD